MLRWGETRLRAVAASHPTNGKATLGANASTAEEDSTALLLENGYRPAFRLVEMALDDLAKLPPEAPPRAGITLRRVTTADYRSAWETMEAAYAQSPFATVALEDSFRQFASTAQPDHWWAAWDGTQMAGICLCEISRGRGEVAELSVRAPWRRRGIGRSLLLRGLHDLRERNVGTARLHTSAENIYASWRLYESVGFRRLKEYVRYRKPME
jgi:ribosomal protein S18 acetylase RimI-like enzyme